MSKVKRSRPSLKQIPANKKWYELYDDIYAYTTTPISEVFLDRLFQELVEWAESDEDALKITQFFLRKRISSDSVKRFRARDKKYDQAFQHALAVIGNRREIGALKNKFNAGIVGITMPRYDKEWVELLEWKAAIQKSADGQQAGAITVVMESFPSGNLVPPKTIQEEKL